MNDTLFFPVFLRKSPFYAFLSRIIILLLIIGVSSAEFSQFSLKVAPSPLDGFIEDFQAILVQLYVQQVKFFDRLLDIAANLITVNADGRSDVLPNVVAR